MNRAAMGPGSRQARILLPSSGELIDSNEGNLKWIADGDLRSLALWPSDLLFLDWLEAEKIFSARFEYNERDEMLAHEVVFHSL